MGQSVGAVFALRCAREEELRGIFDGTTVCLVSPWVPLAAPGVCVCICVCVYLCTVEAERVYASVHALPFAVAGVMPVLGLTTTVSALLVLMFWLRKVACRDSLRLTSQV